MEGPIIVTDENNTPQPPETDFDRRVPEASADPDVTFDLVGEVFAALTDGPDAVDREQLDLAVEFARDVCDYADDGTADKALTTSQPLGKFVGHVLEPETVGAPSKPYAEAVAQWETLERFVESRLRQE